MKSGRSGLGHDTELYRKRTAVSAARILSVQKRQKLEENRQLDFRERQRTAFVEKRAERDLYKSQKVCEQLDAQKVANVLNTTLSIVFSLLQCKIFCAVLVLSKFLECIYDMFYVCLNRISRSPANCFSGQLLICKSLNQMSKRKDKKMMTRVKMIHLR